MMVRIFPFGRIFNYSRIEPLLIKLTSFVVINHGVAGCCTGLALSFPGSNLYNLHLISFCILSFVFTWWKKKRPHVYLITFSAISLISFFSKKKNFHSIGKHKERDHTFYASVAITISSCCLKMIKIIFGGFKITSKHVFNH